MSNKFINISRQSEITLPSNLIFLWVEFPAACRDHMKDERIYTQKPQRDGTALPFGISSKVPSVDI